jgi:Biopolymer transport proteins
MVKYNFLGGCYLMTEAWTYFQKGGLVMYPLLIASIFVVAIAVERYLYFKTEDPGKKFVDELVALLRKGQWDEAKTFAQNKKGTFGRILAAAMEKDNADAYSLEAFLETESGIFIAQLRERLNYLSVIVTMSPLLGLLGTIVGMISAFSIFNMKAGQPMAITGGIGEALIATATGLCVAIVALTVHSYYAQRLDTVITEMELSFSVLMESVRRGDRK